jgi:hypothetical protein
LSQIAKNAPKLSTMVGENFEISSSQIAKNAPKLSNMVGEIFKICLPQMPPITKINLQYFYHGNKNIFEEIWLKNRKFEKF